MKTLLWVATAFLLAAVPLNAQTGPVAFVGPVMSYREYVSSNLKRLTDEEWKAEYAGAL